jgi:H+/Cl- antiporter ClcA
MVRMIFLVMIGIITITASEVTALTNFANLSLNLKKRPQNVQYLSSTGQLQPQGVPQPQLVGTSLPFDEGNRKFLATISAGVSITAQAFIIGVISSVLIGQWKIVISNIDNFCSSKFPVLAPLFSGILTSSLYQMEPLLSLGPATISSDRFSLPRQLLRVLGVTATVGLGCSMALAGPSAELGMTVGRCVSAAAVDIGATLGFGRHSSETSATLCLAGAAAGLAANFNAPLTGVIYSIEVS